MLWSCCDFDRHRTSACCHVVPSTEVASCYHVEFYSLSKLSDTSACHHHVVTPTREFDGHIIMQTGRLARTLFHTARTHSLSHGSHGRSFTWLAWTLFHTGDTARMHALSHGSHARSFTWLACTLFHMARMHALSHGSHARSFTRLVHSDNLEV
jgi:hypothetical protein